jgi:hypothetical protein
MAGWLVLAGFLAIKAVVLLAQVMGGGAEQKLDIARISA